LALDSTTRRLHVSDAQLDFRPVRALIAGGAVPSNIEAIIYLTPRLTYLVCGRVLRGWIKGKLENNSAKIAEKMPDHSKTESVSRVHRLSKLGHIRVRLPSFILKIPCHIEYTTTQVSTNEVAGSPDEMHTPPLVGADVVFGEPQDDPV
jgi:hypothetical protein